MQIKFSKKLSFCSSNIWRKIFLFNKNPVFRLSEQFVFSRSSVIPQTMVGENIKIYSGKAWHARNITKWSVGFKFGELTWNRKVALFKAKQLKKKK